MVPVGHESLNNIYSFKGEALLPENAYYEVLLRLRWIAQLTQKDFFQKM
ncbi:hypothetical protein [Mycoplasmopsis cynos]